MFLFWLSLSGVFSSRLCLGHLNTQIHMDLNQGCPTSFLHSDSPAAISCIPFPTRLNQTVELPLQQAVKFGLVMDLQGWIHLIATRRAVIVPTLCQLFLSNRFSSCYLVPFVFQFTLPSFPVFAKEHHPRSKRSPSPYFLIATVLSGWFVLLALCYVCFDNVVY